MQGSLESRPLEQEAWIRGYMQGSWAEAMSSRLYISKLPNVSSLEVYVAHYELSTDGPALQLLKSKCR